MSNVPEKNLAMELLSAWQASVSESRRKETDRRAMLSPTARAAEDAARVSAAREQARRDDTVKRQKISERVKRVAGPFKQHRSFTITEFACLLHGVTFSDYKYSEWFVFVEPAVKAAQKTVDVLASAVRTTPEQAERCPLLPLNPSDAAATWRFPTDVLLHFAKAGRLGHIDDLESCFGAGSPPLPKVGKPAPPTAPTSFASIPSEPVTNTKTVGPAGKPPREKSQWQKDTDTLMAEVRETLSAKGGGDTLAAFCKKASAVALYKRYLECFVPLEQQKGAIASKTFREYVRIEYPEFKFARGDRGHGNPDHEHLRLLLDGE